MPVTIREAADALRARQFSSVELTTAALGRIGRLNATLRTFITVTAEAALKKAAQADAELAGGRDRGPLHGIPIAVKDLFFTRGVRTTAGSLLYRDFVPDHDAAVGERLERAGAVMMGKRKMHELAYGITSENPHFGAVRNPWNVEHSPGGSSGGSGAAVAAGMVYAAMGSDTGGSIRIPASFCGTVGLKPTYGRVSRYGALPLGYSLDHMGPLTRSVRDAATVLNAIAGHDRRDEASSRRPTVDYAASDAVHRLNPGAGGGHAGGERFQNRQPEALEQARIEKRRGALEETIQLFARNPTREFHAIGQLQAIAQRVQFRREEPMDAADDEAVLRMPFAEGGEGAQQAIQILVRVEGGDRE